MGKLIMTIISLLLCFGGLPKTSIITKVDKDRAYIRTVMRPYRVRYKERIRGCIQFYAYAYDLPVPIFTRLAEAESGFRYYKINDYSGCVGIYQVSPEWWGHLGWQVGDGKYAKYLNKHKGTNVIRVMKYIGANTQMGAIILADYKKRYGTWAEALRVYGGFRAKRFRHKKKQYSNYVAKVLVDYEM